MGRYTIKNNVLYLNSFTYDSIISYSVIPADTSKNLIFACNNYDNRTNLIYEINQVHYIGDSTGSLIVNSSQSIADNVIVKIPFPEVYNSSCFHIYDTLYAKIDLAQHRNYNHGVKVEFNINYNYFNWIPWVDSLEINKRRRLISKANGAEYELKTFDEKSISINYLSRCLMPYFPIRRYIIEL